MDRLMHGLLLLAATAALITVASGIGARDPLTAGMLMLIAIAYVIGCADVYRFRAATRTLSGALASLTDTPSTLDEFLRPIDLRLQGAVRARIESGLWMFPGPALAGSLTGMLVMLGMLGTFLGMSGTLSGAMASMEASSDMTAVLAGLSAPIKGLGLAFGASIAGVATSAALGLQLALVRRDRQASLLRLSTAIDGPLRPFSLAHQRADVQRSLAAQAAALPIMTASLQGVAERIEAFCGRVNETLAESGRVTAERMMPVMQQAVQAFAEEGREQWQRALQAQASRFDTLASELQARLDTWSMQSQSQWTALTAAQQNDHAAMLSHSQSQHDDITHKVSALLETLGAGIDEAARVMTTQTDASCRQWATTLSGAADELRTQWSALHAMEMERMTATLQSQTQMQTALMENLGQMADRLQAPIAALVVSAREVPEHTAQVLERLRDIDRGHEAQHQRLVAERSHMTEQFSGALAVIEASGHRLNDMALRAEQSSQGLANVGDAMHAAAVIQRDAGERVVESIARIDADLDAAARRSQEQMAYYLAQAREVIDYSLASQRELLEEIRRLSAARSAETVPHERV